ncbi:MAG: UDP-N-acetylmuramoyl-L-alanine--D-glutamate ligase [Candidatus Moranbacteria bacterium]|nr:UDP-N-acetylmuramoyl-L-alanine--D-glutamate ligase [Candidatus Moranbacteria bacterium]
MADLFNSFIRGVKNKRVIVWGLGLNQGGLEAAKFFAKLGADVTVVDMKSGEELSESLAELEKYRNIRYIFGRQDQDIFASAELIIKNPAISWELPLVKKLLKNGKRIETDVTLFFRFFRGRIVGVTGSKGKTTTTTLIGKFLKAAGRNILLGGNIRVSLFAYFTKRHLSDEKKIAVLELSSFQLEDLVFVKRSPDIAVVTNILRDHLNRYGSYTKYAAAKKNICLYQKKKDYLVLNAGDKRLKDFNKCSKAKILCFSAKASSVIPAQAGIQASSNNQSNITAAIAVARIFKVKKAVIEKVIKNFKGVPYRMEKIAVIKNITFINDTTATIPDAAIAALESLDSHPRGDDNKKRKIILVGGGSDKNLRFSKFAKIIARKVKKIILLPGTATPTIKKALAKHAPLVTYEEAMSMDKAVKTAYKSASAGDVVLLSPGATSFGLFKNEFDRGDQFNEAVKKLEMP